MTMPMNYRRWALAAATAATVVAGVAEGIPAGAGTQFYTSANGCYLVKGGTVDFGSVPKHQTQLTTPSQIYLADTTATTYTALPLGPLATGTTDCTGYSYTLIVSTVSGGPIAYLSASGSFSGPGAPSITTPTTSEVDVTWTKTSTNSWFIGSLGRPAFAATMNFGKANTDSCVNVQFKVTDNTGAVVDAAPSSGPGQTGNCGGTSGGLTMQG